MMRYALVKPDNTIDRLANNVDPNVQTKTGFKWLPCDPVALPAFDSTSEAVDGPTYTVGAKSVTEVWAKRSLTAQELGVRKDARISNIDNLQFQVSFDIENRVRALEGKAAVTAAQYRTAFKARL